ncbi:hypothetical protein D3C77_489450 [compost metagenome]
MLLVVAHFGNRGAHAVGQIEHAEAAIAKARAVGVHMGEGRRCVGAAGNTEGNLVVGNQLQPADFILQPWIRQDLELEERLEILGVGHVIEQGDGGELGVDQPVGLQILAV